MQIEIKPLDTLFFRDGKPFTMSEDTWGNSIFPPAPSVFYGALRTVYIAHNGGLAAFEAGKMKNTAGTPVDRGSLTIKNVYLKINQLSYFPAPLDLVISSKDEVFPNQLKDILDFILSNYKRKQMLISPLDKAEGMENKLLSELYFKKYLTCKTNSLKFTRLDEYIYEEPKIGISIAKDKGTASDEHLYRAGMLRLDTGVTIQVNFSGLEDFPKKGLLKLGGEGKAAVFRKTEECSLGQEVKDEVASLVERNGLFKLVLTTPALFSKGWLPGWLCDKSWRGEYKGVHVELLAAAIGKPLLVSGWDIHNKGPKETFKCVPPGSVYYFKTKARPEDVLRAFHDANILNVGEKDNGTVGDTVKQMDEKVREGFAHTYVGGVLS